MNPRWLLHPVAITTTLLLGLLLLWSITVHSEPDGCVYDREAFDAIRNQSRFARQDGRHDKATILDFSAAILRCQPAELEKELASAMSKIWNKETFNE